MKLPGTYTKGKYDSTSMAYKRWKAMMNRCYNPNFVFDDYQDCSVCEEWMDFQTYAEWFYANCPGDPSDFDVDKDLIVPNNHEYSPLTCVFLPHAVNILVKNDSGHNQYGCVGVTWDKEKKRYRVGFSANGKRIHGRRFKTPEEAGKEYKRLKKEKICEAANLYRDVLSDVAYNALMNYEPKI